MNFYFLIPTTTITTAAANFLKPFTLINFKFTFLDLECLPGTMKFI